MRFAVVGLLFVACGGGAATGTLEAPAAPGLATPPAERDDDVVGFVAGESMRFDVKVAGVLAGQAQIAVGAAGRVDGVQAIAVSSRIESAGAFALLKEVRDEATSVVDMQRMVPIAGKADVKFGDKVYHADSTYQAGTATIKYQPLGGAVSTLRYAFGDQEIHDAHTAMAKVRTWRAEPGDRMGLWMIGGRRIWRSEIWSKGVEVIGTKLGNQSAIKLEGTSVRARPDLTLDPSKTPRSFTVWLSDDADRVPLLVQAKTEFGELTIELVDYVRP